MDNKTNRTIKRLCNVSGIFFAAYILCVTLINFRSIEVANYIFGAPRIEDYVIDWSGIIRIIAVLLLFLIPFFLIRNIETRKTMTIILLGVLLILFAIVIVFIIPIVVNYYQIQSYTSGQISEGCYAIWAMVSRVFDLLNILLYPAIVLLAIACFMKYFSVKK
ncbi:MAG: hypothetical protein PHX08_26255 [Lachnospiraceae bacterium]|nr:hypothetical protein [Lachnospiraceae bacterium]